MLHSKQWHYSLHRDFQNCYSTRRSPTGFLQLQFYKGIYPHTTYRLHTRVHMHPENSPSRIQFYIQKTKSSLSTTTTTTTYKRAKRPSFEKRNSMHRRQGDLLEIHPCVLQDLPKTFQAFQPQDLPKAFQTFQTFQVIHDLPAFPGISTSSSTSRVSTP